MLTADASPSESFSLFGPSYPLGSATGMPCGSGLSPSYSFPACSVPEMTGAFGTGLIRG